MATATVTQVLTKTITASSVAASSTKVPSQGGILDGSNPSHYDPKNPIILFIIQAGIIIIFCRLLHYPLSKIRQPRVIAEVIGGIMLGPSVMGRIPGFTAAIFPAASMPNLSLVANLGLVLFLFLVGLEVDLRFLVSNWKVALSVGAAGMALPFGLGCAIAWGLYHEFRNDQGTVPIDFPVYMLFIGVAMAITAFPVLCRILTELKLLSTPVGIIVLSAGVGNDVVGWILLALCVALVNAGTGLTALWVLLTCAAFALFLVYAVRPVLMWVLTRSGSLQDGPSQSIVALTLMIALASAFFTGVIGVHPIFGAFMAGLICPHEGGFAIKLTEKVEDLVSALFLPLYFALSGLSTNLGLLNSGITWAYVVGVIAVAFFGKVIGGAGAARANGMVWRECFTIGALMSCKGLVELIVLNIGLQAKILSTRTFTIFVVMALITTFTTTPLVAALYPPWYQKKIEAWKRGEIDWDTGRPLESSSEDGSSDIVTAEKSEAAHMHKILIYLRLDSMPGLLALTALFGNVNERLMSEPEADPVTIKASFKIKADTTSPRPIEVHGVRILELTERDSSVMKVAEVEEYSLYDPLVNTFRAFGRLHNVAVSGEVVVVPQAYYADTLASRASEISSDLLLLPWSETGSVSESNVLSSDRIHNKFARGPFSEFVAQVLEEARCNTAVFVNKGFGGAASTPSTPPSNHLSRTLSGMSMSNRGVQTTSPAGLRATTTAFRKQAHHIFLPYLGSADDRLALRFVLRLASDARVTLTVVHFKTENDSTRGSGVQSFEIARPSRGYTAKNTASATTTSTDAAGPSESSTNSGSGGGTSLVERHAAFLASLRASLPDAVAARVTVETASCASGALAHEVVARAMEEVGREANNAGDLVVVGRNAAWNGRGGGGGNGGVESCLGEVGEALTNAGVGASLLVMQAGS